MPGQTKLSKKLHLKFPNVLSRVPLTLVVFIIILVIGIVTESRESYDGPLFDQKFGWDLTTIQNGKIYATWAGLFFSVEPFDNLGLLIILVLSLGTLEYRRKTLLAAFGFFVIGPIASIITVGVLLRISNA